MKAKALLADLAEVYTEFLQSYQKLFSLSKELNQLLEAKEVELEQVENILAKKSNLLAKTGQLEKKVVKSKAELIAEFDLTEQDWLIELVELDIVEVDLKQKIKKLANLIQKISQLEEKNQKLLTSKADELGEELNRVKQGSKVNKSYNKRTRIHSTYIDDKS